MGFLKEHIYSDIPWTPRVIPQIIQEEYAILMTWWGVESLSECQGTAQLSYGYNFTCEGFVSNSLFNFYKSIDPFLA